MVLPGDRPARDNKNHQQSFARSLRHNSKAPGNGGRGPMVNFLLRHGWWMILLVLAVMLGWIAFTIYRFLHADFAP